MTTLSIRVARVGCAATLCTLTGLGFGPVFGGFPGPGPFVRAALVATAVGLVVGLAAVRWPRVSALAFATGGAVLVLAGCAAVAWPGGEPLRGPWQLLSGALPADAEGPVLFSVAVFLGWAAVASCLLAAQSRSPLPALFPPLICLIAGRALGGSAAALPGWYPIAALVLVAALLAARSRVTIPGVVGVLALTGVVAALAAEAPGAGWREPVDARNLFDPPLAPLANDNPFQRYLAYRNGTIPLELAVRTSADVERLRLVTLTDFDGETWRPAAGYRRAGTTLPGAPAGTPATDLVSQRVDIRAGTLGWLPTAGRPTRINVPGLGVDEQTGDLAIPQDRDAPKSYEASSRVLRPRPEELTAAPPANHAGPATYRLPRATQLFLNTVIRDASPGTGQLLALWRQFARSGQFAYDESPDAPGGHGLHAIERMFTGPEPRRGTSEQYASAYAVLARALGYDARVVLGFRRPGNTTTDFTLTGRDVAAWAEVRFVGLGWVELDPSPLTNPIGTRPNRPAQPAHNPANDPVGQASDDQQAQPPDPPAASVADAAGPHSPSPPVVAIATLILGTMLLLMLAIPVVKAARRRRRRRAPATRAAIIGAWRESLDRLRELGLPTKPTQTTTDIVTLAAIHPRTGAVQAPLRYLSTLVDQARYAPDHPEPTLSTAAWSASDAVHTTLHKTQPLGRRLAMLFNARSLTASRIRSDGTR
jgi:transglutaminase-like putative cysteine protease